MKIAAWLAFLLLAAPAWAAGDPALERMAICQDSWLDWNKSDPALLAKFGDHFRTEFSQHGNDPFLVPSADVSVLGLPVAQAFPESVGMGVGFSLTLDASFDMTRRALEKKLGHSLEHCDTSDGMRTCELEIADKRTVMLVAGDDPKSTKTLLGCYYYYEK